ncbi:phosphotransferase [Colletotrichum plurivorum]|uniref:Phosphotransferase n=1 Tax=Colletotrichum plurivorum TaxID=2175906 RepID=A0A8H6NJD2_9PEZI|nr:phosphotransferase [Colletotrichum plurivorum]
MYKRRQKLDDMAWDQHDAEVEESRKRMVETSFRLQVRALVRDRCGQSTKLVGVITAGFNFLYKIRFPVEGEMEPRPPLLLRAPWPSAVRFPGEKTLYEAATLEYLRLNTGVPVPRVLCSARESDAGPMFIMHLVDTLVTMTDLLEEQGRDPDLTSVLNPDIPEGKLRSLWGKMASIMLELAKLSFPRIGSLLQAEDGSIQVAGRPLTHNMNAMTQLAHIPSAVFPAEGKTFATADEWYLELSRMHLAQLVFQHNDLVAGEDDCRNKYVARQLFRGLAKQGRLSTFGFSQDDWSAAARVSSRPRIPAPDGKGGFRLWCDDFRPTNVLVRDGPDGEVEVAAAIDWDFAYAAPVQFALDPPWWLLFEQPEMWLPSGVDEWSRAFEGHLETWLRAVEEQEDADSSSAAGFLGGVPLSAHMRESWETGRFWLNYAARKSWAFDAVFWNFLDERFFGARGEGVPDEELWKTRVDLLGREEREAMEPFVRRKMEESRERVLVEWETDEARRRLSELLFEPSA